MRNLRLFPILAIVAAAPLASCGSAISDVFCVDVEGTADLRAPGFIVAYREGVPVEPTTTRLAEKYHFTPRSTFEFLPGFSAELSDSAIDGLRCESVVRRIEHNALAGGG